MRRLNVVKWLRDVPISRKLYFTVGLMGLLIIIELATLTFAIHTLSSVRAYVGAEGLYSKAQKDAAYRLQKYGRSRDEKDYQDYLNFLKVPLGDRKTRTEMAKANPDFEAAKEGFLQGRVHEDDIDGALMLFRRFHSIYYIDKAIQVWTKGDEAISEFTAIGDELHAEISSANSSPEKISAILGKLDPVNERLTSLEDEFSFTLGEGSRWLENLILKLLFSLVLTVEVSGLTITILVSRGISRGLKEIINSADKIAEGDLTVRAKMYSGDEIGILANAFNEMTCKLEENIGALRVSQDNLKASKKIAEQSVVVKEHFLANMSHEIRTPMNAVMGFTDLLAHTELDEEQKEILHSIKVSGQSLMTLINDILDYSKIESGMVVIEHIPFSIRKTFSSLQVMLQQKAYAKKISLALSVDPNIPEELIGDPTRLMQILLNLSDNALKFTESGSVEISASRLPGSAAGKCCLEFRVRDTGQGIPADKLQMIFDRFTQVSEETTRKHGGTGLGLSIVRSLLALQNGTINLESQPGKGTTFIFHLTYDFTASNEVVVALPEPATTTVAQVDVSGVTSMNILVAEDNPLNQLLIGKVLKQFGFNADIAANGKIAVEKVQAKEYDLILMDIQMPEMDGYEATTIIRKQLKYDIPIVALTAHAMNQEREKCLGLGMNDFISKPYEPKHLYAVITTLHVQRQAAHGTLAIPVA